MSESGDCAATKGDDANNRLLLRSTDRGAMLMWGSVRFMRVPAAAALILVSSCTTIPGEDEHIIGLWGGPHAGVSFQGGLGELQFDCASGTVDEALYPTKDGSFAVKGTYRTGAPGPIKVGQFFTSQEAKYSGQIVKPPEKGAARVMTLFVAFEDGTKLGPFTLIENSPPEITRCL